MSRNKTNKIIRVPGTWDNKVTFWKKRIQKCIGLKLLKSWKLEIKLKGKTYKKKVMDLKISQKGLLEMNIIITEI